MKKDYIIERSNMETILRSELETADKRIIVLESTIESYKQIVAAMDERIELMEKSHAFELENFYTKNK
tara:strand:+ start:430 stop:633 length:204 start_codon:yes stop_codon:yes gene_type:complete